jgi:DNA polymerase elongation subunit (family B)
MLLLGVPTSLYSANTKNDYNGKESKTHSKYLVVKDDVRYRDSIGFIFDRKNEAIADVKYNRGRTRSATYDFTLSTLNKVEEVEDFDGYVYDIEVEDTHVFFANDILVHNTDSAYMKYPEKILREEKEDIDNIVTIGDTIGVLTNEAFPDFCKTAFNCPDDRKHIVQTERETVFDKAFFLSKKRYILHVVDDEGERVDKLKIMGVEIKKSNTADAVKEMLMRLVEMILDGYDEDEVKRDIRRMKDSYADYDLRDIATPMNCKTLKTAQDQFEATGSMKGLHYSARSAMFYNSLCGPYDKQINPGEKIGLLYVRHPKSKYIGFPLDASNLPDWLYEIQIDYDTMWDKAHKTITNYLESLEWDSKSKKKKTKEKLFGF